MDMHCVLMLQQAHDRVCARLRVMQRGGLHGARPHLGLMCLLEGQYMQGLHLEKVFLTLTLLCQYPSAPPGLPVVLCPSVTRLALRLCPSALVLPHLQPQLAEARYQKLLWATSVTNPVPMRSYSPNARYYLILSFLFTRHLGLHGCRILVFLSYHKEPAVPMLHIPCSICCVLCVDPRIDRMASALHLKALPVRSYSMHPRCPFPSYDYNITVNIALAPAETLGR